MASDRIARGALKTVLAPRPTSAIYIDAEGISHPAFIDKLAAGAGTTNMPPSLDLFARRGRA